MTRKLDRLLQYFPIAYAELINNDDFSELRLGPLNELVKKIRDRFLGLLRLEVEHDLLCVREDCSKFRSGKISSVRIGRQAQEDDSNAR
jgi:hypothetical protein